MEGLTKYYKYETSVNVQTLENKLMRHIMFCEKLFAAYKLNGDIGSAEIELAMINEDKRILAYMYHLAGIEVTDEAKEWLKYATCVEKLKYLGLWCNYWYKWKNEVKWDDEKQEFIMPIDDPEKELLLTIFGKTCDNCMYACYEENNSHCLCGIRNNLFELPHYELRACSHFIEDKKSITEYASEIGITEEELNNDTGAEENSPCERAYAVQNAAHRKFHEEQGSPKYEPEESHLNTDEEYDELVAKFTHKTK